jgi:hypothetical protein
VVLRPHRHVLVIFELTKCGLDVALSAVRQQDPIALSRTDPPALR